MQVGTGYYQDEEEGNGIESHSNLKKSQPQQFLKDKELEFWVENFPDTDTVLWDSFLNALCDYFGLPSLSEYERFQLNYLQLKYALQAFITNQVTLQNFASFLQWFGNLTSMPTILNNITNLFHCSFFVGFMDAKTAERLLKEKDKKGAYIARFGSVPATITLTSITPKPIHFRVECCHTGGKMSFKIQKKAEFFNFQDIEGILQESKTFKSSFVMPLDEGIHEILQLHKAMLSKYPQLIELETKSLRNLQVQISEWEEFKKKEMELDACWELGEINFKKELSQLRQDFVNKYLNFEGIEISIIPSLQTLPLGKKSRFHVVYEIKVGTHKSPHEEKTAFDLAIVLDRSNSMKGAPLDNSLQTIRSIIRKISADDKLHLITYDTNATVVFENGTLSEAEQLVHLTTTVHSGSATNIEAGLRAASVLLTKHKGGIDRSKRIFLFSDGKPTRGECSTEGLVSLTRTFKSLEGIVTSSFGIGDSFDENLMQHFSETGGGEYYYIDSAENIEELANQGLEGLLSLVGEDTFLKVNPAPNCKISKIYGHSNLINTNGTKIGDLKKKGFLNK